MPAKDRCKGKPVTVERKSADCYLWKAKKDSALEETLAVSVMMRMNEEKLIGPSSLVPEMQTKSDGKHSSKAKVSQRPESVWEEISKTVQRLYQREMHEPLV